MASMDVIVYPGPVDRSRISLYLTTPGSKFWASKISLSLSAAVSRAAALGYDAIEVMPRALDDPEPEHLRALTKRHGLAIAGLASGFIAVERGLTFTHPDPAVRRAAMEAFLGCLEMAQRAGAPLVSIGVIRGKLRRELGHAVAKALRASGYRGGIGLEMAFEPDFDAAARQGIECVRRLFE